MKKSIIYFLFTTLTVSLLAFVSIENNKDKGFNKEFAEVLRNAKTYTLEVAEKMPAEDYNFRPHDSVRTFGEQIAHIGMATYMIHTMFIKGEELKMDPAEGAKMEQKMGQSKEECINQINKSFDNAIATLEGMSDKDLEKTFVFMFAPDKPEFTKEQGFIFLRDHITHHRGQAITYLRIKGHDAPRYRAF